MTALPSYSTGTVTVAANGTTVTAAGGANWSGQNALPGDLLQIGGFQTIVSDFPTATAATIPPWGGGTQTAQPYKLFKTSPQRINGQPFAQAISDLVTVLNGMGTIYAVADALPDPSIGDDGQYALKTNTGVWKLWLKVGGTWVDQGSPVGTNYRGAWNSATAYASNDVTTRLGSSYIAKAPNTNAAPESSPTSWDLLAGKGDKGDVGTTGATGTAATVNVNTTITLGAGSAALVENLGTSSAASFRFSIPQGPQGIQGVQGAQGVGLQPDATGTLAQRATYDNQATGYKFLETDVSPYRLFVKASNAAGDWAGPTYIGGNFPVGDMGHITDSIVQTFEFGHIV
jgi:hypothetical protein